jgi:4-amino-4-deoxy-L-arabinose transferase-like glycosyltransferase
VICVTAFVAVAILSARVFEHVPHSEDEVAYVFQAKVFAQNLLSAPTPRFEKVFWSPFVVDYRGQRFGKYPPGWPFLLSFGVRLKAAWLINALLATFTLGLIALLGRMYYCRRTDNESCYIPLIAIGLGLVTPGFLFLSSSLLSHSASLFWTTLALIALFYVATTGFHRRFSALALGACLGAAFLTRPFAALGMGLATGIFLLFLILRDEISWTTFLWVILGSLPLGLLLFAYWWALSGDPMFNAYLLVWPYDRIGFGPDIGPQGYSLADAIAINTRLKLVALATGLYGWPGWSSLLFLPIPFLSRRANRWDWLLLGTILALIFVHIFYWAFGGVDGGFPRYYYDALPALLLLTARGIALSFRYLVRAPFYPHRSGQRFRLHWLLAGVIVILIGYNLGWNLPPLLVAQKGKYDITPAQIRTVERADLPAPALILVQGVDRWSDFAAPFTANSPTLDGSVVYAIDPGPSQSKQLRRLFADRTCWQLQGELLKPCPSGNDNR